MYNSILVGCTSPCSSKLLYSSISLSVLGLDDLKINFEPSGEKKAPPSYPKSKVICLTSEPSIFIVYKSKSPFLVDVKTILSPTGETVASAS